MQKYHPKYKDQLRDAWQTLESRCVECVTGRFSEDDSDEIVESFKKNGHPNHEELWKLLEDTTLISFLASKPFFVYKDSLVADKAEIIIENPAKKPVTEQKPTR